MFGKTAVLKSLGTSRLSEARLLAAAALSQFEELVAQAAGLYQPASLAVVHPPHAPSQRVVDAAVRLWLTDRMSRVVDVDYASIQAAQVGEARLADLDAYSRDVRRGVVMAAPQPSQMTQWLVEDLIDRHNWDAPQGSSIYRYIARVVARGQVEGATRQRQDLSGEPRVVNDATFAADQYLLDAQHAQNDAPVASVSLTSLFEGYVAERKPADATVKAWRRQVRLFEQFVGNEDATQISFSDVLAWKDSLLHTRNAKGVLRSAKTVSHTYLSALRTVLQFGCDNNKINDNPAAKVRIRIPKNIILRDRGLTDDEAAKILRATFAEAPQGLSKERALARRWVPWLCAYTGARVNEITQLRAGDIYQIREIWMVRLTPEAGSIKGGEAREFALHLDLVDQGFPAALVGRHGPIFYDPTRYKGGSNGNPQYKKVGEYLARWVREIGVTDTNVSPNHGWRHRFKTQARNVGMDPEVRDFIQGHLPRTEGERYGDTSPEVTLREISKLPRYNRLASNLRRESDAASIDVRGVQVAGRTGGGRRC